MNITVIPKQNGYGVVCFAPKDNLGEQVIGTTVDDPMPKTLRDHVNTTQAICSDMANVPFVMNSLGSGRVNCCSIGSYDTSTTKYDSNSSSERAKGGAGLRGITLADWLRPEVWR